MMSETFETPFVKIRVFVAKRKKMKCHECTNKHESDGLLSEFNLEKPFVKIRVFVARRKKN
jgi:molybdenum cofactor biosynthesis enzyme MoaA